MEKINKSDQLLQTIRDLDGEIDYQDFQYKEHFGKLGLLIPQREKEKLLVKDCTGSMKFKDKSFVYVLVLEEKIFKIGHTINTLKERVQSYNCGKKKHRQKGTASVTNYFVLQSLLNINMSVEVYAYFPDKRTGHVFGVSITESFPSTKSVEKVVLAKFVERHGRLPVGCTQH